MQDLPIIFGRPLSTLFRIVKSTNVLQATIWILHRCSSFGSLASGILISNILNQKFIMLLLLLFGFDCFYFLDLFLALDSGVAGFLNVMRWAPLRKG